MAVIREGDSTTGIQVVDRPIPRIPSNTSRTGPFSPAGTLGALEPTSYVGGTRGGPPTVGTFARGNWVIDSELPAIHICTASGSPGTWETISNSETDIGGITTGVYTHIQYNPLKEWPVNHGLDGYPAVVVVDSAGSVIFGDIQYIDRNNVLLKHSAAFAGKAYFNRGVEL